MLRISRRQMLLQSALPRESACPSRKRRPSGCRKRRRLLKQQQQQQQLVRQLTGLMQLRLRR